jgi:hypothetical protein
MGFFNFFGRRPTAVREAVDRSDEDRGWRRASYVGGTSLNPERDELDGENLLRECYRAYRNNPLAYAVIEQTTSFVLGGGARVVAEDARVQKVIDEFWNDPDNNMPVRIYSIQTELSLFGEQFIRYYVDSLTGRTLIRQLDPLYLTQIRTHPEDIEHPLEYLYQPPAAR